jgi:hypothetical protein
MKATIIYKYDGSTSYPFKAIATIGEDVYVGVSDLSFDESKVVLLSQIKKAEQSKPTIIPEPEVIEI